MVDLELTRAPGDRRKYVLEGIGSLRLDGFASRAATAEADGATWSFRRVGFWRRRIEAVDRLGTVVGEFDPHGLRRGGAVRWAGPELLLRAAGSLRGPDAL